MFFGLVLFDFKDLLVKGLNAKWCFVVDGFCVIAWGIDLFKLYGHCFCGAWFYACFKDAGLYNESVLFQFKDKGIFT